MFLGRVKCRLKAHVERGYQGWILELLKGWCRVILIPILTRNSFNRSTPSEVQKRRKQSRGWQRNNA